MKIPVDECPAGPAMDAAVAKELGCKVGLYRPNGKPAFYCCGCGGDYPHGPRLMSGLRRYSADIAAAWEVHRTACAMLFSKRRAYFKAIQEQTRLEDGSLVAWPDVLVVLVDAFPEAVCRAFLKANGVTHVEGPDGED